MWEMRNITERCVLCVLILLMSSCAASPQTPELVVQTSHGILIQSIAFSPDGEVLATGGGDGTIKLWDVKSGRQIRTLAGHPPFKIEEKEYWIDTYDPIVNVFEGMDSAMDGEQGRLNTPHCLAFSPDGKTLASGGNARTIIIWDVASGEALKTISTPGGVWFIAFSQDGSTLLSQSEYKREQNSYKYWDVASGNELRNILPPLSSFRLPWQSPDRSLTVRHSEEEKGIKILNSGGNQVRLLEGHEAGVRRAIFSPTADILASGGWDRTVRLWNLKGDGRSKVLGKHDSFVSSLAFSADGKLLASGSADLTIKLWDVGRGKELRTLRGYTINSSPFAFGRGHSLLITNSGGRSHIWDLQKGRKLITAQVHKGSIKIVLFSSDKRMFATSDQMEADIATWARNSTQLEEVRQEIKLPKLSLPADVDSWVNDPESDNIIKLWSAEDGSLKRQLKGHTDEVTSMAFSHDSEILASGSADHTIKLWRIKSEEEPVTLKGHHAWVTAVAFDSTDKLLASGDRDGVFKLWDLRTMKEIPLAADRSGNKISWIVFASDGKTLLSFEGKLTDLRIREWELETLSCKEAFSVKESPDKMERILNLVPDIFQKMNFPFTDDAEFYALPTSYGRIGLYARDALTTANKVPLAWLIALGDEDWAVVKPDGRFDTNKLDNPVGLNWTFPDAPLVPLSFEVFMRDYYEPHLLPRLMRGERLLELPSLAELNRLQPKIEKITIHPQVNRPELVDVEVEVASVTGQCRRGDKHIACESGVYDLRLYRDGQIVGEYPEAGDEAPITSVNSQDRVERLQEWRHGSIVKTKEGQSVTAARGKQTITFRDVRVPRRLGISQVEFTAYAFNSDRVKSATSEASIYTLPNSRPNVKPRAYVITVGVDATSDPSLRLGFAPTGAREVESLLRKNLEPNYKFVPVQLISEYKKGSDEIQQVFATKDNIRTVLNLLSGKVANEAQHRSYPMLQAATPDDLVVIYVASHGYADPDGKFYVIPSDIGDSVPDEQLDRCLKNSEQSESCQAARAYLGHSISSDELTQWLQTIDAGQMVLILDSCHSGAVSGPNFKPGPMGDRGFGQLSYDKGMLVLAATQAEKLAWGGGGVGEHSLLIHALINQGQTAGRPFDLRQWLSEAEAQVPNLYRQYVSRETPQEPVLFDFVRRVANH
jgi:WD40 repeat protein